ncbi:MAG: SPASM domain-containing protein [Bacteroidia bacterium]|nr:SPASM domain-containing protein [Bacteroidia bacterium]
MNQKINNKVENNFRCNLPNLNMYISQDGTVKVCCYNHHFEIGNLNNNTLLEIWNSYSRKDFAKSLHKNTNEKSCSNCSIKQQVKKDSFFTNKSFKNAKFPKSIELELSNNCNLECVMCSSLFSDKIAHKLNLQQKETFNFQYIIQQLSPFISHLSEVKFYGGEPFLIEKYYEIWEYILEQNSDCKIYLQTNGTILNNRIKTLLNKGKFNIGVSIESINPVNYAKIRVNATLEKVLTNINYFYEYSKQKKTYFGISVCPLRHNWQDIPALIEYFNKLKISVSFHNVVQPFYASIWNLKKEELLKIHNILSKYNFKETKNKIIASNINNYNKLVSDILNWHLDSIEREKEYETYINHSIDKLLEEIYNKVKSFLDSLEWMKHSIKESKISCFIEKLDKVCKTIENKDLLKSKLIRLQFISANILISETDRISIDEFKDNLLAL